MDQSLAEVDEQAETQAFLEKVSDDQFLDYIHDMVSELQVLSEQKGLHSMAKIMSLAKYETQRHKARMS